MQRVTLAHLHTPSLWVSSYPKAKVNAVGMIRRHVYHGGLDLLVTAGPIGSHVLRPELDFSRTTRGSNVNPTNLGHVLLYANQVGHVTRLQMLVLGWSTAEVRQRVIHSRGCSLKKIPSPQENPKIRGFKVRLPNLGVNNSSNSVFDLFFIHKIRKKSEKI